MSLKAADYLSLPERIDNVIRVEMTEAERELYRTMERQHVLSLPDSELFALTAAAVANKLLQMANGYVYDEEKHYVKIHEQKLEMLKELADTNTGKPMLVFYNFRHDLVAIQKAFPKARELKTDADVEDWNQGRIDMLLAHPASAGYGLNLQAGGHIIVWYGLTWSWSSTNKPMHDYTGKDSPKRLLYIILVTAGTMDEQVMRAIARKEAGQNELLDAIKYRRSLYETMKGECI